ncbi:MAG: hypothetical protein ABS955_12540, partial [Stenotrophomonas maltophilia]
VTPADLLWLLLALLGTLVLWALIYNSLLVTSVDPFLARSRGIRTRLCGQAGRAWRGHQRRAQRR